MKQIFKTLNRKSLIFCGLLSCSALSFADCTITNSGNFSVGNVPSIYLTESGQPNTQFSAGLACSGLGFVNRTYLQYVVSQQPTNFVKAINNEKLRVSFLDFNSNPTSVGVPTDISGLSILNFFTGPNGSIPFYINIPAGQVVSPGTYVSEIPFNVKWYYSVPGLAVGGVGIFYQSPGFVRPSLISNLNWGTGLDSSLSIQITVLPDCRISTNNVNFGTAAFAAALQPVQTSMGIRCSASTPYRVSLNNGLYPQTGNQRAMKLSSGNNFMNYEIYKNNNTAERWGSGSQSWSSANATTNAGVYNGLNGQSYSFNSRVLATNSDSLPAGTYSDTITVQVEF